MRINTNIMALNAQNVLGRNQTGVEGSIKKLSSGLRVNGAADDASGLAISEKMRAQIRGLDQAHSNASDGISLLQTAEGALQQTTDILHRMRELIIKAENSGVLDPQDQASLAVEVDNLKSEIDRIAQSTTFNGKQLLDGTSAIAGNELKFKIGANPNSCDTLTVTIGNMGTSETALDIKTVAITSASASLAAIDRAIVEVSSERSKLGAIQNRMEYAMENLSATGENLTSAESRIRDVDMAKEMVSYTKNNILQQSAMAMLAQANQQPEQILTLLE